MQPTQSARLVDVAVVRTERPPAGCITCEAMCDHVYIDTAVIMHVYEHDMQTIPSHVHIMWWLRTYRPAWRFLLQ